MPPTGNQPIPQGEEVLFMVFFDATHRRKLYVGVALVVILICASALSVVSSSYFEYKATLIGPVNGTPASYSPGSEKTIALTFDDGPDPEFTPTLLALLQKEQVPATFFLIGSNVLRNPDLAKKIVDQGHEIGNHTFSHWSGVHSSPETIRDELLMTDRAIVYATGHSTFLYRPPFLLDVDFGEVDGRVVPNDNVRFIEALGFLVVGADIDTTDWEKETSSGVDEIYNILVSGVHQEKHVVLLHDHGGGGATIEALKRFIPEMKAQGYSFVTTSHYFGLSPAEVMPPTTLSWFDYFMTRFLGFVTNIDYFLYTLGAVIGIIGFLRMWLVFSASRMFTPQLPSNHYREQISKVGFSVIIPAYNEETNIAATLRSILRSNVLPNHIIVVDDGSTDQTSRIVEFLSRESTVHIQLLRKNNGGTKAEALRYAFPHVNNEIVVCIDADTIVDPRAFEMLIGHFEDDAVGAVAGKIYPATTRAFLEKLQYLEYVQGQNLDKKVFALGSSVGIVPGAIGAWRTRAVKECGGYSTDTVVEDQDLTLALLTNGWKVEFEPSAIAFTETPNTLRGFFTQRLRWMYGTLQCFYKYDAWFFSTTHPWLGFVILPNMLIFGIVTPFFAPLIDFLAIASIAGVIDAPVIVTMFCILLAVTMWLTYEALSKEERPKYSWLWYVIPQHFLYQYVCALAVVRSVVIATSGTIVRWGTIARRGAAAEALPSQEFPSLNTQDSPLVFESQRASAL